MAGIDESIVREFFEINGFFVTQLNKYQVQSRKKRAEEEIDMAVENPRQLASDCAPQNFVLTPADLKNIGRAVLAIRPWHTSVFSEAAMKSSRGLFNFLQKSALDRLENSVGSDKKIFKILVIPSLPKSASEKSKSVRFLKSKGIDGVLTFFNMLRTIADSVEVNNNYVKSDLLQTLRILKNYNMLRDPQMDFFRK